MKKLKYISETQEAFIVARNEYKFKKVHTSNLYMQSGDHQNHFIENCT